MEDDAATRRCWLPHRRRGGRRRRAGGHQSRHRALMALRPAYALHRLGLPAGGAASSHPGGRVQRLYLARVRERIRETEEQVDPPAGVDTVGELVAWLARRDEQYAYAFEN